MSSPSLASTALPASSITAIYATQQQSVSSAAVPASTTSFNPKLVALVPSKKVKAIAPIDPLSSTEFGDLYDAPIEAVRELAYNVVRPMGNPSPMLQRYAVDEKVPTDAFAVEVRCYCLSTLSVCGYCGVRSCLVMER